jgi:hypothetical protein
MNGIVILIYVLVEIALGVGSYFGFHTDHDVVGWVCLVLFVLLLIPIVGDDVLDIFSLHN